MKTILTILFIFLIPYSAMSASWTFPKKELYPSVWRRKVEYKVRIKDVDTKSDVQIRVHHFTLKDGKPVILEPVEWLRYPKKLTLHKGQTKTIFFKGKAPRGKQSIAIVSLVKLIPVNSPGNIIFTYELATYALVYTHRKAKKRVAVIKSLASNDGKISLTLASEDGFGFVTKSGSIVRSGGMEFEIPPGKIVPPNCSRVLELDGNIKGVAEVLINVGTPIWAGKRFQF